ncbi:hypothetical protein FJT64_025111 [Amphibalanus amphitrite]|uniref:Uncharacterized protein n=1 Tax=Amphibalanus amphitrite TaxID=1232801 RepID=A0A6A4WCB3_AMPAM|nr:hypothetical protein FJT64_025111 [Amphibalanus amphitrite]
MKALELKHLRARKERERQKKEQEDMLRKQEDMLKKEQEDMLRKQEDMLKEQEDMLEEKAMEEEVERALVKARLCKAAESDLEWERRHDFDGENVALVPRECNVAEGPVTVDLPQRRPPPQEQRRTLQPEQQTAANNAELPSSKNEQHPANWVTDVRSEQQPLFHQQSAFVKSIPRLTLPTFRGSAQEWPRWIGLFKALVHNQPSLSDSKRMAHLQNAVEGPAAQAINGMLFNGELYQEALKTLQERFGREEDIIQAHLRKIFTSTPPSLMDLPAMEQFYSVVHNTRRKPQESSGKRTFSGTRRHVPEKMNPADDCSRGLAASELTSESRWLSGPAFLSDDEENWPAQAPPPPLTDDMEEVKSNSLASVVKGGDQPERLQGADYCRCRRTAATAV